MLSISEHRCVFHEDKLEDTKWVKSQIVNRRKIDSIMDIRKMTKGETSEHRCVYHEDKFEYTK